jgi:Cu/Ag efflux pump CusA
MKITQYTIKNRIAASVIVLGLVVLGLYGLWRLPVNFLPNMAYPLIKVYVWWPGATPNEIEALPGFPWVADLLMSFPEGTNEGYGPIFSDSRADRALVC